MIPDNNIKRRDFLKALGTGTIAASTIVYAQKAEGMSRSVCSLLQPDNDAGKLMTKRKVTSTGQEVSLLGYGGMRWPTKNTGERHGGPILQDKVNELIDTALAHGVTYFDTAPVYHSGQSEKSMGIALKRHPRESFQIATKLSNFDSNHQTLEDAKKMYENSFRLLQVDYIDFYLLHSLDRGTKGFVKRFEDNGVLEFLKGEREKGRIHHLGFSFHGDKESLIYALNRDVKWDFVQIQLNYFDWSQGDDTHPSASYLYEELTKRGIPVVVMEPLLGGRLAKVNDRILAKMKERDAQQSPASWAFRFVGGLPNVLTVLSGMTYMEHLEENLKTFSPLNSLTEDDNDFLQDTAVVMMKYPVVPCTGCRYCMPCPFGVDIPGNFAYFNKCVENGEIPTNKQSATYLKLRKNFLKNYSKNVSSKKQAVNCKECGRCLSLCPQHIKIPEQLQRINSLVENLQQE